MANSRTCLLIMKNAQKQYKTLEYALSNLWEVQLGGKK